MSLPDWNDIYCSCLTTQYIVSCKKIDPRLTLHYVDTHHISIMHPHMELLSAIGK